MTLSLLFQLQEQRIRQRLLTQRDDLPETVPVVLRSHDAARPLPSVPRTRQCLTDEDIATIRLLSLAGMRYTVIGKRFHVSHTFVSAVCKSDPLHRRYVSTERKFA